MTLKKWSCFIVLSMFFLSANAQLFKPTVGKGTIFYYTLDLHGQQAQFELSVKKFSDSLTLEWRIRRLTGGAYTMTPAARQRALRLNFAQPAPNAVTQLSDNETFLVLSKDAFNDLKLKSECQYDNTIYVLEKGVTTGALKIGDKTLDALHITAKDETTELWILNDAEFPIVCKVKNNPMGVDFSLNGIK